MSKKGKGGASIVADKNFTLMGEVRADSKKRVVLKGRVAKHYYAYQNEAGQILLEPMTLVPEREMWLYRNPKALASLREGIRAAKEGRVVKMSSLSKYADEPLDE